MVSYCFPVSSHHSTTEGKRQYLFFYVSDYVVPVD